MKTKQRALLALLAAAVLLGAALWAVIRSNAKAEQSASAAAEGSIPLSSFAAEDLEQIEYTYNGETYTLQYSGGSWLLAQDPAYHLDESACNTMRTALMAAAVLLGAALWAVIRSNAKAEQSASAAAEGSIPLSSFAAEDLEQIEYTYNGETYTLQYSGGSWLLAQDPAYHLDESACNTMRTALMALNAKRSLTPQAGEDYGLDSPQLTVTVTAAGQSTTLTFGAENPVTGDLYAQKAGDDAIYTVSGNKAACFQLDKAGLFGSFCPTGLTASAITQVAYTLVDGSSVTLNAVSEPTDSADSTDADSASSTAYETVWRLASDPIASLAQDKVQSLLSALCTYATAQITDADLSACGFDAPVFTAAVTSEDGSTVQLAYACGTDGWYLQVEGDTSAYTVDTSTVQALLLTENDLKTQE